MAEDVTINVEMTMDLEVDEEGSADLLNDLMSEIMEQKGPDGLSVFQPAMVYSNCPYASQVEFGTGPLTQLGAVMNADTIRNMELWVQNRWNEKEPERVKKLAVALKNMIEQKGIAPSPYFRSSAEKVMAERCPDGTADTDDWLEKGMTLPKLADEIRDTIKSTLEMNGMTITRTLIGSIYSEPIMSYTISGGEVQLVNEATDSSVTDDMWKDKSLGREGKRPTKYWRYP